MYGRLKPGVASFVILVLLWGAVFYAAWYYASRPISTAVGAMGARIVEAVAPVGRVRADVGQRDIAFNVEPQGDRMLRGELPPGMSIDVPVNPLKHTFGIPFFLALIAASRAKGLAWKAPLGAAIVGTFAALGVACDLMVSLFAVITPRGVPVFAFGAAARETIAVGYQLGTLVLPTVVPVLTWAAMDLATAVRLAGNEKPPAPV